MKEKEEKVIGQATPEQIAEMKEKHGDVFEATAISKDGKTEHKCYLRCPTRLELSYATKVAVNNPLGFNDSILKSCWLAGDECIKTNEYLLGGVSGQIAEIISIAEASIKKL
jgi:hypothetical protein